MLLRFQISMDTEVFIMIEPTLVILAAGMGSRFGGLKQIMAVDDFGHAIIDFSLYDAYRAGFRKVAFIIKHEIEEDFKTAVGRRMEKYFDVKYVYQQLDLLAGDTPRRDEKQERLEQAMDAIRGKYGKGSITFGNTGKFSGWDD